LKRAISIMWKFGRRTRQKLNIKIKCSSRNHRMRMKSSRVAQQG